jgi:hypothetical protein
MGVHGPSSTCAAKVPQHHSLCKLIGVGRGRELHSLHRVSFAPSWSSLLACTFAKQSRIEQNLAKSTPLTRFGKLLHL